MNMIEKIKNFFKFVWRCMRKFDDMFEATLIYIFRLGFMIDFTIITSRWFSKYLIKHFYTDIPAESIRIANVEVNKTFWPRYKYEGEKQLSHPYHLVDPSPWPFLMSISVFNLVIGLIGYMHRFEGLEYQLIIGIINVLSILIFWWRDVIRESTFEGMHTRPVQWNLKFGVVLFIISEVMFFFGFFWAYFYCSLAPSIWIGAIWPPSGIQPVDPYGVPLLNTLLLLASGFTITFAHHFIIHGSFRAALSLMWWTILYASIFTVEQFFEYLNASFNINDSIYGSLFYMLTGFHGFHVIIGTIFIIVCTFRLGAGHFTQSHHVGFESAAWYWHFVDVVWLCLYLSVYWWSF